MIGWANVSNKRDSLEYELGFVDRKLRDAGFNDALEAELTRLRIFLA